MALRWTAEFHQVLKQAFICEIRRIAADSEWPPGKHNKFWETYHQNEDFKKIDGILPDSDILGADIQYRDHNSSIVGYNKQGRLQNLNLAENQADHSWKWIARPNIAEADHKYPTLSGNLRQGRFQCQHLAPAFPVPRLQYFTTVGAVSLADTEFGWISWLKYLEKPDLASSARSLPGSSGSTQKGSTKLPEKNLCNLWQSNTEWTDFERTGQGQKAGEWPRMHLDYFQHLQRNGE